MLRVSIASGHTNEILNSLTSDEIYMYEAL